MFDINWGEIWGVIITTTVIGIVKYMYSFLKDIKQKSEQEQRTKNNIIQALMKNNEELTKWKKDIDNNTITFQQEIKNLHQTIQKITQADLVLMRDRILQTCRHYLSKGAITLPMRENLTEMYHCYQIMGGNGIGKLLYEQVMKLPIKDINILEGDLLDVLPKEEMTNGTKTSKRKRKQESKVENQNQTDLSIH